MARNNHLSAVHGSIKEKAAIYIRVSTKWQVDKDSLQVQRRELTAYAEMLLGISDYEVFEDPGYSAKNTNRPEYQRMMNQIRSGEFSHLLVWKLDRISRNLLDFVSLYNELKALGVAFISKNEQFDTSTAMGEAMIKIALVFAELERKTTAERVTAVMLSRANNGQWNGGRVPYGYSYQKGTKKFSVNPAENKIVSLIYASYLETHSIIRVAAMLNEMNLTTRAGCAWSSVAVHKILSNPFYVGDYRYNVHDDGRGLSRRDETEWIIVKNHHEPSVSREQFELVQARLKRNLREKTEMKTYRRKNTHIFSGLLRCALCDSGMSATPGRIHANGWRPSTYGCAARRKTSTCTNRYISDTIIIPFVFAYVSNLLKLKKYVSSETTYSQIEKMLLQGTPLVSIKHISSGIPETKALLLSGVTGVEYAPSFTSKPKEKCIEFECIETRIRKLSTAMTRLQSLYLFSDEKMPEKDYIIAREKIAHDLAMAEAELSKLREPKERSLFETEESVAKANYFLMLKTILSPSTTDFIDEISQLDNRIPASFLHTIISNIYINDGRVMSICFKNGITHRFEY